MPFQPSLMFVGKALLTPVMYLSGAPFKGRLLALLTNIMLSREGLPRTNTLAYYEHSEITAVKSFITYGQVSRK